MPSQRYFDKIAELKAPGLIKQDKLDIVRVIKEEFEKAVQAQKDAGEKITVKPDYANLLELYQTETDEEVKEALQEQAYKFTAPLTEEEKSLFNYIPEDYIEDNPGYNEDGEFVSYIGSFPDPETGEYT